MKWQKKMSDLKMNELLASDKRELTRQEMCDLKALEEAFPDKNVLLHIVNDELEAGDDFRVMIWA